MFKNWLSSAKSAYHGVIDSLTRVSDNTIQTIRCATDTVRMRRIVQRVDLEALASKDTKIVAYETYIRKTQREVIRLQNYAQWMAKEGNRETTIQRLVNSEIESLSTRDKVYIEQLDEEGITLQKIINDKKIGQLPNLTEEAHTQRGNLYITAIEREIARLHYQEGVTHIDILAQTLETLKSQLIKRGMDFNYKTGSSKGDVTDIIREYEKDFAQAPAQASSQPALAAA